MLQALWIQADSLRPTCALFQAGYGLVDALNLSKHMKVDLIDIPNKPGIIEGIEDYDIAFYNYSRNNFFFISPENYKRAKHSIVFTLDTNYESPWAFWSEFDNREAFDYIADPDPTLEIDDPTVIILPRCCPRTSFPERPINTSNPIISTYGFPYRLRLIPKMIDAMNEEFDTGLFRMHYPSADPSHTREQEFISSVLKETRERAKPGIEVEFTNTFKTREEMLAWLNESDANVFLNAPERFFDTRGSLPAGTDWAVSALRPMIVSETLEMRHIVPYVDPYPTKSFRQIMEEGIGPVQKMYEEWSPSTFSATFDSFLEREIL